MTFRPPLRLSQAIFWLALAVAFAGALWPDPPTPEVSNLDKAVHFTTFYILEILALLAFPRANKLWPLVGLLAYGALMEGCQALVGRDMSGWDLVADICGALAAVAPLLLVRWIRPLG